MIVVDKHTHADARTSPYVRPLHAAEPTPFLREEKKQEKRNEAWPRLGASSSLCWHCCHAFDGAPVPLAIAHDARTDAFTLHPGVFCGYPCAKTFSRSLPGHARIACSQTLLRFRATGSLVGVVAAPPRSMLSAFGGPMSIDEFRGSSFFYSEMPQRFCVQTLVVEKQATTTPGACRPAAPDTRVTRGGTAPAAHASAPNLRLKRTKPVAGAGAQLGTFFARLTSERSSSSDVKDEPS